MQKIPTFVLAAVLLAIPTFAKQRREIARIQHVPLISIDGMHALDVAKFV